MKLFYRTDWDVRGFQLVVFERGCQVPQNVHKLTECEYLDHSYVTYKDCSTFCAIDGCNNSTDIELSFANIDDNGNVINIQ